MAIASKHANEEHAAARQRMVDEQIAARGIRDPAILKAFLSVPREAFVSPELAEFAHEDTPLPIEADQTISQPYIVALMTDLLQPQPDHTVLEIGTGSGYQAAVLAELVRWVYSIEVIPDLAEEARTRLRRLGYRNVSVKTGDGNAGWPEHAPFDGIIVTAAAAAVPEALPAQLRNGGRLVIPVGQRDGQDLMLIEKSGDGEISQRSLLRVAFVPLVGG
jgi:protein-L-isoaspartate(D-aspartate) O-methyltransferase